MPVQLRGDFDGLHEEGAKQGLLSHDFTESAKGKQGKKYQEHDHEGGNHLLRRAAANLCHRPPQRLPMNESDNGFFDHRENSDEDEEGDRLMERLPDEWPCPMSVCFKGNFDLNRWMVTSGWAVAFRRYSLDYVVDEDAARRNRINIWSGNFDMPWDWRSQRQTR
jgi:hypothetical protein